MKTTCNICFKSFQPLSVIGVVSFSEKCKFDVLLGKISLSNSLSSEVKKL